jgi:hypothetical protein
MNERTYADKVNALLNQLLPQARYLVLDIGLVNELAIETTRRTSPEPMEFQHYRGAAKAQYAVSSNDDIEVDDDAAVSVADDGAWVQAWVWVPNIQDGQD